LLTEAARFEHAVDRLPGDDSLEYTGWTTTAARLRMHSHSEAALHRWDIVGDDDVSVELLSDPAMIDHAIAVFAAIPALREARRWSLPTVPPSIRLRAPGQPDAVPVPGGPPRLEPPREHGPILELTAHERILVVWGRCPARLRHPEHDAEPIDAVLARWSSEQ
jgi:hypothetical protein